MGPFEWYILSQYKSSWHPKKHLFGLWIIDIKRKKNRCKKKQTNWNMPNRCARRDSKAKYDSKNWGLELSNSGFGLKISQILREMSYYNHSAKYWFPQTAAKPKKAPLLG